MSRITYEPCPRCRSNGSDSRGDNLVIWPDGSKHCFACRLHIPAPYSVRSMFFEKVINEHKALLPIDFTKEIPRHALKWLLQWELPWSYWQESIGYSPSEERLVFRVGTPLQFSIGRSTLKEPPKETDRTIRKWYVWGDCHKHVEVIGKGQPIILVEDLISAHKVGQITECIPLFGNNIFKPLIYYLLNQGKPVKIWLDKDQESKVKKKAIQLQSVIQCPVDIIVTDKDPKTYSIKEISNGI